MTSDRLELNYGLSAAGRAELRRKQTAGELGSQIYNETYTVYAKFKWGHSSDGHWRIRSVKFCFPLNQHAIREAEMA